MVVIHLNETRSLNITCNRQSMTVTLVVRITIMSVPLNSKSRTKPSKRKLEHM